MDGTFNRSADRGEQNILLYVDNHLLYTATQQNWHAIASDRSDSTQPVKQLHAALSDYTFSHAPSAGSEIQLASLTR